MTQKILPIVCFLFMALPAMLLLPGASVAQVAIPSSAALQRSESAFEMVPGVVVDPSGDAVFLMSPGGVTEAVRFSSGELLWSSDWAAKPLALYGDLLLAQVETPSGFEIAILDARRDGWKLETLQVSLPSGLFSRIDDTVGYSFKALARVQAGVPLLSWESRARYTGGVAPAPNQPLVQEQSSAYRLDVQSARAIEIDPSDFAAARPSLPQNVQAWADSGVASVGIERVGKVLAATETTDQRQKVLLKRWEAPSGAPLADIELHSGPYILELPSADGRHLLISERVDSGDFLEYEWSIFSLENGERLGQVRHQQSHAPFYVFGQTILYEARPYGHRVQGEWQNEPHKIHAVLLGSGSVVWERALRDTSFKGQSPP